MSFTSLAFYPCLAAALAVFYLTPGKGRVLCLLILSCLFYLSWNPGCFALLAGATVLTYAVGLRLATTRGERTRLGLLLAGIVPVIGMLVFFKAANALAGLLMPIGVSFYTFKLVSYLLEAYWDEKRVERRFIAFASFATFAPQMISGPIQRPFDFFPQLAALRRQKFDYAKFEKGFALIIGGLLLKLVIGDRLGGFIAAVDRAPESYAWPVLATGSLCYILQLYADFAGYTNIALGIGLLFGIEGPPNFNAPFAAANMQEFWRRWHMSLTTWLVDYVFMPLRMATRGFGKAGLFFSIMLNMMLIGLWHGFTSTFLVFGLINGLYLCVSVLTLKNRDRFFSPWPLLRPLRIAIGIIITFLLVSFSQIFWQAGSLQSALLHIDLLFGGIPCGDLGFGDMRADIVGPVFACMTAAFYLGGGAPGARRIGGALVPRMPHWVMYGFGFLILSALTTEAGSKFIYGQF